MRGFNVLTPLCACLSLCALAPVVEAADTTEVWAAGELEFDLVLSHQGAGRAADQRSLSNTLLVGYGVTDRISLFGGMVLEADEAFAEGEIWPYLGVMAAALDSDHLDLDLILETGASTLRPGDLELWPGLELNLDLAPDQARLGLYTLIGLPLGWAGLGSSTRVGSAPELRLDLTVGAYLTVAPGHQLFLASGSLVLLRGQDAPAGLEETTAVVGYNVQLSAWLEWVNQVGVQVDHASGWRPGLVVESGVLMVIDTTR